MSSLIKSQEVVRAFTTLSHNVYYTFMQCAGKISHIMDYPEITFFTHHSETVK